MDAMCQAPVGRVIGVDGNRLTVEYNGGKRELRSKLSGVTTGDYIIFSVDIAIEKVEKEEAEAIMGDMK
jgi:hydrogenase maturation factor